ncbi:MAG TPA: hypothetical protein VMS22_22580 [Candidatus Eisenbacteria bacterium]|nr:hypothetical protein [Candidatus Eisenbacteria bacterium]
MRDQLVGARGELGAEARLDAAVRDAVGRVDAAGGGAGGENVERKIAESLADELRELAGLDQRELRLRRSARRRLVDEARHLGTVRDPSGALGQHEAALGETVRVLRGEVDGDARWIGAGTLGDGAILRLEEELRFAGGGELVRHRQLGRGDADVGRARDGGQKQQRNDPGVDRRSGITNTHSVGSSPDQALGHTDGAGKVPFSVFAAQAIRPMQVHWPAPCAVGSAMTCSVLRSRRDAFGAAV